MYANSQMNRQAKMEYIFSSASFLEGDRKDSNVSCANLADKGDSSMTRTLSVKSKGRF